MKAFFFLVLSLTSFVFGGCKRPCHEAALYHISGRQKPIICVLPVVDHTKENNQLTWDLSREFTDEIRKRVYNSKKVYLLKEGSSIDIAHELINPNPRAITGEMLDTFAEAQFIVVTEILEQKESPFNFSKNEKTQNSESGVALSVGLRVRVLDIRNSTPRVILQEVLKEEFIVAKDFMHKDYAKTPWGSEAFMSTPMGMAHHRLVKELVSRTEAYIEAAL